MSYKLQFSSGFDKQLKKLHQQDKKRVIAEIEKLAVEPFPKGKKVKHLVGSSAWRLRVGKIRVIYLVDDKGNAIYFEDVAYRKDIY